MTEVKVGQVYKSRYDIPDRYVRVAVIEHFVTGVYIRAHVCRKDGSLTRDDRRRQPIIATNFQKRYDLHRDFTDGALTAPLPPGKPLQGVNPARARRGAP